MKGRPDALPPCAGSPSSSGAPLEALLWSLRQGWGVESCSWVPRPARAAGGVPITSGEPLRPREIDWSPLADLAAGAVWRPGRRRSPRAAASLLDELWVAPRSSTARGLLRAVGEARQLPAPALALAAADRLDQLSRVIPETAADPGPARDVAWAHDLRNRLTHALLGLERFRSERNEGASSPLDEVTESLRLAREACHGRLQGAPRTDNVSGPLRPILLRATRSAVELAQRRAPGSCGAPSGLPPGLPSADRAPARVLVRCPAALEISADPDLLFRALENLTLNALQASSPGSSVRVEARGQATTRGDIVSVTVRDEGRGMGRAELEAFRTPGRSGRRAEGGTGYGTASLFECLERLRAELDLETQPGVGTTACIRLPGATRPGAADALAWSPWDPETLDPDLLRALRSGSVAQVRVPRGACGARAAELLALCREHAVRVELASCRDARPGAPRASDQLGAPQRARGFDERRSRPAWVPNPTQKTTGAP